MSQTRQEFFATCGTGLEPVLGDELRDIGVRGVRPLSGGVSFAGDLSDAYRACLWSRVASHVLLTLARIDAADADALYAGVRDIPWEQHLPAGCTFAVTAHGRSDALRDTRFTALRVKDAVVDRLRDVWGQRPDVDAKAPDLLVNVVLRRDRATVSIDLSGTPLEHRGYRMHRQGAGSSVRANLAAALLLLGGWTHGRVSELRGAAGGEKAPALLLDPRCGAGVLAIEAALIAGDVAPGIQRPRWGFEGWAGHDERLWAGLLAQADERAEAHALDGPVVVARDEDAAALEHARACARRAGVAPSIRFEQAGAASDAAMARGSLLACALPLGAARAGAAQMPALCASLSERLRMEPGLQRVAVLADTDALDAVLGAKPAQVVPTRSGSAACTLRVYDDVSEAAAGAMDLQVAGRTVRVRDRGADQFAARLAKVYGQRSAWAREQGVHAYRVYDADLPDYKLAIDVYEGAGPDRGKRRIHIAEYAPPRQIDPAKAARRVNDALVVVAAVCDVGPTDVFLKRRVRSKGGSQYAFSADAAPADADAARRNAFITAEGGLLFETNLADRLDTGLFFDHRDTRALLRTLAKDKVCLNLFAYTGTASVYMAAGGARYTTTVDLSNTYLAWARRNFELNGLLDDHQEFERADVVSWVADKRHTRERWDLVFVDPPTYSNSAKTGRRTWDVQRDHAELLIGTSRLLSRGGAIVFSCNLRKFELDAAKLARAGVQAVDITAKTIPADFERDARVHRCYLLRRA